MVVDEMVDAEVNRIFHALADATRRDILTRVIRDEQSVTALARHFPMSFAAVQKHVTVLERAALITKHRRGREQIVHINVTVLHRATQLLEAYEQIWRHRTGAIEALLADDEK